MAELAPPDLIFDGACPDCGERVQNLPLSIPGIEDDFDWRVRDYDSFRLFMMQELASRFPERRRWTSADIEVVIVELLAAALDRASHAIDRVQAERFLDTARRPESVRRLLSMIGWTPDSDELARARANFSPNDPEQPPSDAEAIEKYWQQNPKRMERARHDGPREIAGQNRMVTLGDHAEMMERHPLCALARAKLIWSGAWHSILVSTLLEDGTDLDAPLHDGPPAPRPTKLRADLWTEIAAFHSDNNLPLPNITPALTGRHILRAMIDQYRMIGSEVFLEAAQPASVTLDLSVRAKPGYFRSELKQAVAEAFTAEQGGFFEPGRLDFGQSLYASDVIEAAMAVEGVEVACLNLFKRTGRNFPDQSGEGVVRIDPDAFIRCMNDPRSPDKGTVRITVQGGETG